MKEIENKSSKELLDEVFEYLGRLRDLPTELDLHFGPIKVELENRLKSWTRVGSRKLKIK